MKSIHEKADRIIDTKSPVMASGFIDINSNTDWFLVFKLKSDRNLTGHNNGVKRGRRSFRWTYSSGNIRGISAGFIFRRFH